MAASGAVAWTSPNLEPERADGGIRRVPFAYNNDGLLRGGYASDDNETLYTPSGKVWRTSFPHAPICQEILHVHVEPAGSDLRCFSQRPSAVWYTELALGKSSKVSGLCGLLWPHCHSPT